MTMSKDDENGKDNNSKDDGDKDKEDNNDGGNGDSGGGGISAGGGQGSVRLVAVLWRALVVLALTHRRNHTDMFRNIIFWSKLV
jgi:hypothetical protein